MPWGRKASAEPTSFDLFRDAAETKITCGVDGCMEIRTGTFAEARSAIAEHRAEAHPGWKPPRYRVRGRKRERLQDAA